MPLIETTFIQCVLNALFLDSKLFLDNDVKIPHLHCTQLYLCLYGEENIFHSLI